MKLEDEFQRGKFEKCSLKEVIDAYVSYVKYRVEEYDLTLDDEAYEYYSEKLESEEIDELQ